MVIPTTKAPIIIAATIASLAAIAVLSGRSTGLILFALSAITVVVSTIGIVYVARHREWLAVALVFCDQLFACTLIPAPARTAGHYLITALICIPSLPLLFRSGILRRGGFRLYTIYFGWALITVIWSLDPMVSLGRVLMAVMGFCAISAAANDIRNGDDVTALIERLALGYGVLLAIVAASLIAAPQDISWDLTNGVGSELAGSAKVFAETHSRFRGIFESPNQVGALTLLMVAAASVCWPASGRWKRVMIGVAVAAAIVFGVLAKSRTPFVALGIGIALEVIRKYRLRGAVACGLVALTMWLTVPQFGLHRDTREDDPDSSIETLSGRTDVWHFAVKEIERNPFMGYGYEVEGEIFKSRDFPVWWGPWDEGARASVHSAYLERAVGVGIPALLLWLFIVLRPWVVLFRRGKDSWNLKPLAFLVVVPIMVHSLTESMAGDFIFQTGLIFGLIWAIAERQRLLTADLELAARRETIERRPPVVAAVAGFPPPDFLTNRWHTPPPWLAPPGKPGEIN